jgi:hypothetical protein
MFFNSNLRSSSQAGRRGFESRLPLHLKNLRAPKKPAFHNIPLQDAFRRVIRTTF